MYAVMAATCIQLCLTHAPAPAESGGQSRRRPQRAWQHVLHALAGDTNPSTLLHGCIRLVHIDHGEPAASNAFKRDCAAASCSPCLGAGQRSAAFDPATASNRVRVAQAARAAQGRRPALVPLARAANPGLPSPFLSVSDMEKSRGEGGQSIQASDTGSAAAAAAAAAWRGLP